MSKVIASLVVAAVMLVGSSALANGIGSGTLHYQDFGTTLQNGLTLLGGNQNAQSDNFVTINNQQNSFGGACGLIACENQTAFISQVGNANGICAVIDLEQAATALGTQQQTIGDGVGPKLGTQLLNLSAGQVATKTDGGGSVTGSQIMALSQDQNGANSAGPMSQSSIVFGQQNTNVSGAPGATGAAGGTLVVTTQQEQMVL